MGTVTSTLKDKLKRCDNGNSIVVPNKFEFRSQLPFSKSSKILSIDAFGFIIIGSKSSKIHKYNAFRNKWTILTLHDGINYDDTIGINHETQKIYFYNNRYILREFDLKTFQFDTHYMNGTIVGYNTNMICIDDDVHFIGSKTHKCWNINGGRKFTIYSSPQHDQQVFSSLYLRSKHQILIFTAGNHSNEIHSFSFNTNTWKKWKLTLPDKLCSFQAITVRNERYIFFIGGYQRKEYSKTTSNNIYVFDMELKCLKRSLVQCPEKECYYAAVTSSCNELLLHGFVNECSNDILIPCDIIGLIALWTQNEEELHIISYSGCHSSILVHDILRCLVSENVKN